MRFGWIQDKSFSGWTEKPQAKSTSCTYVWNNYLNTNLFLQTWHFIAFKISSSGNSSLKTKSTSCTYVWNNYLNTNLFLQTWHFIAFKISSSGNLLNLHTEGRGIKNFLIIDDSPFYPLAYIWIYSIKHFTLSYSYNKSMQHS